jgi:hypothetical protein
MYLVDSFEMYSASALASNAVVSSEISHVKKMYHS